ncbi:uncharacterized protein BDZ99DRAFT_574238 [Mytilinidion resinicola]|uniref:Uncharacterized protein n=1 Tax=Mytilinidion resinicola TaxID=574789 RepID=A0A6A6YBQ2_9PEZI|nr:uncharacterized protein BDZ99DRAFT_574238 [Mytilinidion resinicola]KAF2806008.1 hypothetical protein BDZ99DRAFT_574238 [Mytilinidion resinicola]
MPKVHTCWYYPSACFSPFGLFSNSGSANFNILLAVKRIIFAVLDAAFDLSRHIFLNQFTIALNVDAARFVFSQFEKFERFVVVPSNYSCLRVEYSLPGLNLHPRLALRCLAFNCRVEKKSPYQT